ncbi:MAG: hypothetical protein ABSF65_12670, partial [Candidatus Bathyarchaeia archaeon]
VKENELPSEPNVQQEVGKIGNTSLWGLWGISLNADSLKLCSLIAMRYSRQNKQSLLISYQFHK